MNADHRRNVAATAPSSSREQASHGGRSGVASTAMADLFLGENVDAATHARTGARVNLPSSELTTHGVIVGMTGSGKTGLGIVLIEECLRNGIPTLLIDPKGDLGEPLPHVPEPRRRPTSALGQRRRRARRPGSPPTTSPPSRPTTWTDGLGGWGLAAADIAALRQRAEFTIYTPGSKAGVPMNIVGSLQAPADTGDLETMRDEIEGYVSGLLGLVGIEADPLSSREHILLSNLIETSWAGGPRPRPRHARRPGADAADPQARRVRARHVLPARTTAPALAMRLNGLLASPSFAGVVQRARRSTSSRCCARADGRPRCAIVIDRAPVRRGAPVRHHARAVEAGHLDAPPERHDRPAGPALHGRGRRLPAARRRCRRPRSRS